MANIIAEERVRCAPETGTSLIEPALQRISSEGKMTVRVPAEVIGIHSPIALEQEVSFRVAHARDQARLNDILTISWEPVGDKLAPVFHGTLSCDADSVPTESMLALQGTYDVPGGLVGRAFDDAVGFWIARATMHDLLERLASTIEELDAERATAAPHR